MKTVTKHLEIEKVEKLSRFDKKLLEREGVNLDVCPDCRAVKVLVPVIYADVAVKTICCECFQNGEQALADSNKHLWYALYRHRTSYLDEHLVIVKGVLCEAKRVPIN